jgi:hypothetical protein
MPSATIDPETPFWARRRNVYLVCVVWHVAYAILAIFTRSALGYDDALEAYHVQSLEWSYTPRNPSLYDWMLYGLDRLTGSTAYSAPPLNYAWMLACALLLYELARRVIDDIRMQALSVYSLSLLWTIGFNFHPILTHSKVMIAVMAATLLVVHSIGERRTLSKYVLLGILIPLGLLAKYAYGVFLGALFLSALTQRKYRTAILDTRLLLTVAIAVLPIAALLAIETSKSQAIVVTTMGIVKTGQDASLFEKAMQFGRAITLFCMPFGVFFAWLYLRTDRSEQRLGARDDSFLRLNGLVLLIGAAVMLFWAFGIGSSQLRPRYFLCVFLTFPFFAFMVLDQYRLPPRPARTYTALTVAMAAAIFALNVASRVAPAETICGECLLSVPYRQFGDELAQRYGPHPTLVGYDIFYAGQLRAALPTARTTTLVPTPYRPPPRPSEHCLLVWQPGDDIAEDLAGYDLVLREDASITVEWWAPLLSDPRSTTFNLQELPPDSQPCA